MIYGGLPQVLQFSVERQKAEYLKNIFTNVYIKDVVERNKLRNVDEIDTLLSGDFTFDESTLRKKLKEYTAEGIIITEKQGRKVLYSRAPDFDVSQLCDVVDFFGETAPCGCISPNYNDD